MRADDAGAGDPATDDEPAGDGDVDHHGRNVDVDHDVDGDHDHRDDRDYHDDHAVGHHDDHAVRHHDDGSRHRAADHDHQTGRAGRLRPSSSFRSSVLGPASSGRRDAACDWYAYAYAGGSRLRALRLRRDAPDDGEAASDMTHADSSGGDRWVLT